MYTVKEERWNTYSHAIGIVLGIIGLIVLLVNDSYKTEYSTISIILYGLSMIMLYTASTSYHAIHKAKLKPLLRKLDHISIYFLIAGTYTPLALISLESGSGWTIFYIVWGSTILGTFLKIFFTGKFELISLLLYLLMGWLVVFYYEDVIAAHSVKGLSFLIAGGVFYTLGTLFYAYNKIPYNHAIWHFFVLAGSVCHYLFILLDVV